MSRYFNIKELVCPHVYDAFRDKSWMFLDTKLIYTLDTIRDRIGKPMYINYGNLTQRGLRCYKCDIVRQKIDEGVMYMSAHIMGRAADFNVKDIESEVVRLWIAKNANWLPYPVRLETGVTWVHLDLYDSGTDQKVYFFK